MTIFVMQHFFNRTSFVKVAIVSIGKKVEEFAYIISSNIINYTDWIGATARHLVLTS